MARMSPAKPTDGIDGLIGFLGFFGVVLLVATVVCELTGRPALGWALALLAAVVCILVAVRRRAALLRRPVRETADQLDQQ